MLAKRVVYDIDKPEDFEKLRKLDGTNYVVVVNINDDIDFQGKKFTPIDASDKHIIIQGNGHVISGLYIDKPHKDLVGLFSYVDGIEVSDLSLVNFIVIGQYHTGSLVGKVNHNGIILGSTFAGSVCARAYSGGAFGSIDNLIIANTHASTDIYSLDIAGGLAGMTKSVHTYNINVNTQICASGRMVGCVSGFDAATEEANTRRMTEEAMQHLPPVCTYEEMKRLELLCKNREE